MFHLDFKKTVPHSTLQESGVYRYSWQYCAVMGIINITPDSFSDGGVHFDPQHAIESAKHMVDAGVAVLDIGGESTRPGAQPIDAQTELGRILPVLEAVRDLPVLISIDTMKPEIARIALQEGAHIINDVTGLQNPEMVAVCAEWGAPAIIMHMQGKPQTMQHHPEYTDVLGEVEHFLYTQAQMALHAGIPSVMIDVGIGFGKTLEHNLTLLRGLNTFNRYPVLLGASRKKMIDWLADVPHAHERDSGSVALHLWAASQGAAMVRVHHVAAHVQALKVWQRLQQSP